MELHVDCQPLAFLLGTWKGKGEGEYPTIESFGYLEEVTFGHVGKPFLSYSQKTKHADTGMPLHAEAGYLRALGGGRVELVLVQPSGIVELHEGTVDGQRVSLNLLSVHTTPSAKEVSDVSRQIEVSSESGQTTLSYEIAMAAVGQPLTHHLRAALVRQPAE